MTEGPSLSIRSQASILFDNTYTKRVALVPRDGQINAVLDSSSAFWRYMWAENQDMAYFMRLNRILAFM